MHFLPAACIPKHAGAINDSKGSLDALQGAMRQLSALYYSDGRPAVVALVAELKHVLHTTVDVGQAWKITLDNGTTVSVGAD